MKVYLAASSSDAARARRWHGHLLTAGITVTSTWLEVVEKVGNANPRTASKADRYAWSIEDLRQIDDAQLLWLLVPPLHAPTRGAWGELLFAYAKQKHVLASGDTRQTIFTALAEEFETDEAAFARVVDLVGFALLAEQEAT